MSTSTAIPIVYADDDLDDQLTFSEIIAMLPFSVLPIFFDNGLSLYQYLVEQFQASNLPRCIILDINMPIWDGIRTLEAIKSHQHFAELPVIMFTTSKLKSEKDRCGVSNWGQPVF